eukprot:2316515-Rhodomonas_salina.1
MVSRRQKLPVSSATEYTCLAPAHALHTPCTPAYTLQHSPPGHRALLCIPAPPHAAHGAHLPAH